MSTQAYNLLWLRPTFAAPNESFRQPIPDETITNMKVIAQRNPTVDVQLWVDSRRMSESQMAWLRSMASTSPNILLQDLRTIPEYTNTSLFNTPDSSNDWRLNKHSLIWRQVDAARILACLQGDYDQVFYSDTDVINLTIASDEIQSKLVKHGIVLGGWIAEEGHVRYENQLFGFDRRQYDFFRLLYDTTVREVSSSRENGFGAYIALVNSEIKNRQGIDTRDIVFGPEHDNTIAHHPEGQSGSLDSKG